MNIKNKILSITSIIIISLCVFFFVNNKSQKKIQQNGILLIDDSVVNENRYREDILSSFETNKHFYFSGNNIEFPILIYRYSKNTCNSCIQQDQTELLQFQSEVGEKRILILPAYSNSINDQITLKNELHKFNYLNIPIDSLYIPQDEMHIRKRYFAVINSEKKMEMIFFPRLGYKELTQDYFLEINKIKQK